MLQRFRDQAQSSGFGGGSGGGGRPGGGGPAMRLLGSGAGIAGLIALGLGINASLFNGE